MQVANAALGNDLPHLFVKVVVAHHIADSQLLAGRHISIQKGLCFPGIHRQGFFNQGMLAVAQRQHSLVEMAKHRGGDVHQLTVDIFQHFFGIVVIGADAVFFGNRPGNILASVHNGDNFVPGVREQRRDAPAVSDAAGADDAPFDRIHQ